MTIEIYRGQTLIEERGSFMNINRTLVGLQVSDGFIHVDHYYPIVLVVHA